MSNFTESKSLSIYLKEIGSHPTLSDKETRDLFGELKKDITARDRILKANLRLVVWQARKFSNCGLPISDLIAEGNCGLMHALEKYNPKISKFSTYAVFWIRQRMRRAIHNQSGGIREPEHIQLARRKINNFIQSHIGVYNARPSPEEISISTKLPLTLVRRVINNVFQEVSLDAHIGDSNTTVGETIGDTNLMSPATQCESGSLAVVMGDMLSEILDKRELAIIQQRHGIGGAAPLTLDEVRQNFGITRERIRQIQTRAMGKIKKALQTTHRTLSSEMIGTYGLDTSKLSSR